MSGESAPQVPAARLKTTLSISQKGFLVISVPLLAQLAFGIALLVISRGAVDAHAWELHSQLVLGHAYGLKTSLLAAQGSLRAYVLTENRTFQRASEAAEKEMPGQLAALASLVSDNPEQRARVKRIAAGAADMLRYLRDVDQLVERGQRSEAVARIGEGVGERLMDRFLEPANGFLTEEERLAGKRHAQAAESNRVAGIVVTAGMVLNIALAATLAGVFAISIHRRLQTLTENARRLADEQPLLPPLSGGDEIAEVDRVFHEMAASLSRATQDLLYANREMEAFSYSVSHDLRTPLRAIDGFSRIVLEEYGPGLDAEGNRLLAVIRRSTVTMAQLIDDLLAFSRLSRQPVTRSDINMRALVEQAFAKVRSGGDEREIELVIGDLPHVRGDAGMLRQVLINLLSNAVKFTAPRVRAKIEVGTTSANGETVFHVSDNGVGFDMRYAGQLFGVFQRLHQASEFEGTGVGLAIVQRVIHRHGGRVWAESILGEGATFYFTVPDNREGNDVRSRG